MAKGKQTLHGRGLACYVVLAVLFWTLTLSLGASSSSSVRIEWPGAAINLVLLVLLLRGHRWALGLLIVEALMLTGFAASAGLPPGGPGIGALALLPALQLLILLNAAPVPVDEAALRSRSL